MPRTARKSHARRAISSTPRIFIIGTLVLLALAGIGLLLFGQNFRGGATEQESSKPEKIGRLIVEEQPKKEELTFYKTLTDRGDKRPPAADLKPPKTLSNPFEANKPQLAQTKINKSNNSESKFYTLQVGSFVEMESAQKLVRKLTGKGYPAYLINTTVADGETRYRVRVGSFVDKVKAKSVAEQLEKQEALKSFITFLEKGSQ